MQPSGCRVPWQEVDVSASADGHAERQEDVPDARDLHSHSVAVGGLKAASCHGTLQTS